MIIAKHKKFTLIELITVIIILVVLAVIALPKYVELVEDAELSAADGVFGAVRGAVHLAYAENQVNGTALPVKIINGYLEPDLAEGWKGTGLQITRDINGDGAADYTITVTNSTEPPNVNKNW